MTQSTAILATLAYHDIFSYPLTQEEIHKYLIGKKASFESIKKELSTSSVILERVESYSTNDRISIPYYALPGRKNLFKLRKQRNKYSEDKLKRALFYSKLLTLDPTVLLVGITGALAMGNSNKSDDIDLLVICVKRTLWTTRFFANLILFPYKRTPNSKDVSNRACLNLFLDESDLKIKNQNLYTAHEICQMKPIIDRRQTYSRFIKANGWVEKYLPNWSPNVESLTLDAGPKNRKKALVVKPLALSVEIFSKKFQLWYMRKKVSTERIGDTQLFFHPRDTEKSIMTEYKKRLKHLR